jgi:hypothetical protein
VNDDTYFSEQEPGLPSQDKDEIGQQFWGGFVALVKKSISNGSLAEEFPKYCFDGPLTLACDEELLGLDLQAEIPSIAWPLKEWELPDTLSALDLVQYFCRYISRPEQTNYHDYGSHYHLSSSNRDGGLQDYQVKVNRLFRRSNLAYELQPNCKIRRLGPPILRETLAGAVFRSEDLELNRLLEDARIKIGDPDLSIHREAVEKLWDAWERLKTLEPGTDKKQQINALLTKAIPQVDLRARIDKEAQALTELGNNFMIRHSEIGKPIISDAESLDYLFYRLFALMHLLLRKTNRTG